MNGREATHARRALARHLRRGPLAAVAVAAALLPLFAAWPAAAGADAGLKSAFLAPPKAAAPWYKIRFPGGDIREANTEARMQEVQDAGFSGAMMTFAVPGFGTRSKEEWARINSYATPGFFDRFAGVLEAAKRRGLPLDSHFGSCFPQGGSLAITPELAAVELTLSHQEVAGGSVDPTVEIPAQPARNGTFLRMIRPTPPGQELPPDWQARLDARSRIVAVLAVQGSGPDVAPMNRAILALPDHWGVVLHPGQLQSGTTLDLTSALDAGGKLHWHAPAGTWQVFVFRQVATDTVISCGASDGPQLVLDPFNRKSFDAFKEHVFDAGLAQMRPYFGATLHGYFIDSSELDSDIFWTGDFLEQFSRRRGYDLKPWLPLVFQPGWMMHPYQARLSAPMFDDGETGERIRADYRLTVSELMTENFYQPFAELMASNGLASRIESHGAPVDTLKVYGLATIPETEDLHVDVDPYFMRMARAAADVYGRKLISTESMIFGEGGPSIPPLQVKDHADKLLLAGVNDMRIDGYKAVVSQKPDDPPSPVAGLGAWIDPQQPTWPFIKTLNAYISRCQAVLQQGHNVVAVALFRPDPTYVPTSAADQPKTEPVPGFVAGLQPAGYDYDQISDDGIARSRVVRHQLVTPGGATYNALVVPATPALRAETARALRDFARAGLPVVFAGEAPHRYIGYQDHAARDAEVRADVAAVLESGGRVAPEYEVAETLKALRVRPNLTFLNGSYAPFLERAVDHARVVFFSNPDDADRRVVFRADIVGGIELWDPWTGGIEQVPGGDGSGNADIAFVLPPHATRLVVIDHDARPATGAVATAFARAQAERPSPALEVGGHGWTLHASGHGAGMREITQDLQLKWLSDWTTIPALHDLSGEGRYATTFDVQPDWLRAGRRYWLDLGEVYDAATVQLNGQSFAVPLAVPHRVDVTGAVRAGANDLVIDVVNMPNNSFAASSSGAYGFRPAGLAGPVWLRIAPLIVEAAVVQPPHGAR